MFKPVFCKTEDGDGIVAGLTKVSAGKGIPSAICVNVGAGVGIGIGGGVHSSPLAMAISLDGYGTASPHCETLDGLDGLGIALDGYDGMGDGLGLGTVATLGLPHSHSHTGSSSPYACMSPSSVSPSPRSSPVSLASRGGIMGGADLELVSVGSMVGEDEGDSEEEELEPIGDLDSLEDNFEMYDAT